MTNKFVVFLKKLQQPFLPARKKSYLGVRKENVLKTVTSHEGGKTATWLTKESRNHTYLDLGDVKPLDENTIRILTSG